MNKTRQFSALALFTLLAAGACERSVPAGQPASAEAAADPQAERRYACPMHPQFVSTDPDESCLICGMGLMPASGETKARAGSSPVMEVAPEMIQTMGVRTAPVEAAYFERTVRAFGNVESSERLESVSVSRLEGWIEDLAVSAKGDTVARDALLYRIYSPALISAQKDYLAALETDRQERIAASRQRLLSAGMQSAVIGELTESRQVIERLPVYAEAAGTVAALEVREGDYVKPGTPILRLQSYARVWIIASVPEADLGQIGAGQSVFLQFPSAPGVAGQGRVDYIYPTIDPRTRTGDVRIEVENSSGVLRPGAYADIQFTLGSGEARLSVPSEAILRDSRGGHVIVALGNGRFAGRAVEIGVSAGTRTEIVAGLAAGETVVVSGQFMLDSEANLREGFGKLEAPSGVGRDPHSGRRR